MSLPAKLAALLVLVIGLAGSYWYAYKAGYRSGADHVRAEWNAEKLAAENQAEINRRLAQASIHKTETAFVAKAKKEREAVTANLPKVDQYAPATYPPLPGSFRVWHDAAAAGEEVDDSRRADAPSVSLKAVASTVADNYASSNYDKQRLEALQEIVRSSGCFQLED